MQKVIAFGEALIDMLSSNVSNTNGPGKTKTSGQETFTKFPGGAPRTSQPRSVSWAGAAILRARSERICSVTSSGHHWKTTA